MALRALLVLVLAAAPAVTLAPSSAGTPLAFGPLAVHGPIFIDGDADFTAPNGVIGGTGSGSDPYVIAGWQIDGTAAHGIEIRNTTAYVRLHDIRVLVFSGRESFAGVILFNVTNAALDNMTTTNNRVGIGIYASSSVLVADSLMYSARDAGIEVAGSRDVQILGSRFVGNPTGIGTTDSLDVEIRSNDVARGQRGVDIVDSERVSVRNNTVNLETFDGIGVYAWNVNDTRIHGNDISGARYGLIIQAPTSGEPHSRLLDVRGNAFHGNELGVFIEKVAEVTVAGNRVFSNPFGLQVWDGQGVVVTGNTVSENRNGARIHFSSDALVEGNDFVDNVDYGLALTQTARVDVVSNGLERNGRGLVLSIVNNVTLRANLIANHRDEGLALQDVSGLLAFHNSFVENGQYEVDDEGGGTARAWDNGYPSGGNFWSDHAGLDECSGPGQDICPDSDGLGDDPYRVNVGRLPPAGEDRYPLMKPTHPINIRPTASLSASPLQGNTSTEFSFDASASTDLETPAQDLEFRWDWEGDGSWDTLWSRENVASHVYTEAGDYTAVVEVRDGEGRTDRAGIFLVVLAGPPTGPEPLVLRPYEHPTAGFRLPIPEGWTVQEDVTVEGVTVELVTLGPVTGGARTIILVETGRDPTVRETDAYLRATAQQSIEGTRRANPTASIDVIGGPTTGRIAGHAAVTFLLEYGAGEAFESVVIVVSEAHRRYWILILTTDGRSVSVMNEGFRRMLDGFVITLAPDPAEPPETGLPLIGSRGLSVLLFGGLIAIAVFLVVVFFVVRSRPRARVPPRARVSPRAPPSTPPPVVSMHPLSMHPLVHPWTPPRRRPPL